MKYQHKSIYYFLIFAFFIVSCSKSDPIIDEPQVKYFQSQEHINSIQESTARALFSFLAIRYNEATTLASQTETDVKIYKMVYRTTFENKEISASGLVCVPNEVGSYPVLCFQNGTNVEYSKAPTNNPNDDLFKVLESIATLGFVVVIPDYLGFGESEEVFHPYLETDNTIPCLVDILKATSEFVGQEEISVSLNNDLYLMGYSQGGWATLQLQHEIEQNGIDDYTLKGSVCGAGPYDLNYLTSIITSQDLYPTPYFLAYLMNAYHTHEKYNNSLDEIFAETYATKIPGLFNGINSGEEINAELTSTINDLLLPEFRSGFQVNSTYQSIQTAFTNNSISAWNLSTPTRLYHGEEDTVVPIEISEQIMNDFSTLGLSENQVRLVRLPGENHQSAIIPFGIKGLNWLVGLKNE